MAAKYSDYLASNVLNEGTIVNYRLLSRALKVHCNTAKEMLYDFYTTQNKRKPGSVHATYLVAGVPKSKISSQPNGSQSKQHQDTEMHSSSFMSSSMPEESEQEAERIPVTSITLVQEEQLQTAKELFETVTAIHMYSLEPGPLNNIQVLSDCNRRVTTEYANEDALETWKQYGTIHNPTTKRRKARQPPPTITSAQAPITSGMKSKQAESAPTNARPDSRGNAGNMKVAEQKPAAKAPALKKDNSNLFKAFSKSKSDPKKVQTESDASAAASPAQSAPESQDESMKDPSEDEHEEDFVLVDTKEAQERAEANKKAKRDRQEQLEKMMEDDFDEDDTMQDAPALATASPEAEAELDNPPAEAQNSPPPADEEQQHVTIAGGRRRGRRRVMKKKTTKDAEGYLVTKEEPAWESFSEDEPEPKRAKAASAPSAAAAAVAAAKAKKTAGKPGQGNIMSFFGKK